MAQDLIVNGVAYNGVESLAIPNAQGQEIKYVEEDSVKLPELTNPGAAAHLLEDMQMIDGEGKVVTGCMPRNDEIEVCLDVENPFYYIPPGFHTGAGFVSTLAMPVTVVPEKERQELTPSDLHEDGSNNFISKIVVEPIPDQYQDVTPVTATAEHVLEGDIFVDAEGNQVEGTMPNIGSKRLFITPSRNGVAIPEGYHDGTGQAGAINTTLTVTPTKETQEKTGTTSFYSKVTVNPIPDEYQDVSAVTATAEDVAAGKVFVDAQGNVVTGTHECAESGGDEEITIDPAKTYIFLHMGSSRKSPRLGVCVNGTVTIDWGDGTAADTLTGTSTSTLKYTEPHTYAEAGDYVITLSTDGEMRFAEASNRSRILCAESTVSDTDYAYLCAIKKVIMGSGVKGIRPSAFLNCFSLADVVIPDTATSINAYAFQYCYHLNNVAIPAGVKSILAGTFQFCYGATYFDFSSHTSVPTLAAASAFSGIPADCEIRVPAALYDEWIAATNWATYASQIVAV